MKKYYITTGGVAAPSADS